MPVLIRLARRTAILLGTAFVASIAVFGLLSVVGGDAAQVSLGVGSSPQALAQLRHRFGLDRSVPEQYLSWLGNLLHGDLGTSYLTRTAIAPQITARLQVTLWLVLLGLVVAVLVAVPAGVVSAVRRSRVDGAVLTATSQLGMAVPGFIAAILLIDVFAVRLHWFPSGGWVAPATDPVQFLRHVTMPVVSLGLIQAALLSRYVRTATLDVLAQDHLRTARAIGLTPSRAFLRHGLRNVAIPVVTVLGLQSAALLVDAIVVERVFVIPGLGSLLLDSVSNADLVLTQAIVMVVVAVVLVIAFVVDVTYLLIDPRLRSPQ